jgi:hypothetical protein
MEIEGIIIGPIYSIVGLYIMFKHNKLAEAFVASDAAFREKMGWRVRKSSENLLKFNRIFLFIFGLIFFLVGLLGLYQGLAALGLCSKLGK